MTPTPSEPELAPPGAGLPPLELFFARLIFQSTSRLGSRASLTEDFLAEKDRILALAAGCAAAAASRRVLIKRLAGMEDSSRYWSVWMTLDHLRIVNQAIASAIDHLGRGATLEREANTAAVKPKLIQDDRVVEEFKASCQGVLQAARSVAALHTPTRYAHPWFGPLDAHGWYAVGAIHLRLHRRQIQKIIAGL